MKKPEIGTSAVKSTTNLYRRCLIAYALIVYALHEAIKAKKIDKEDAFILYENSMGSIIEYAYKLARLIKEYKGDFEIVNDCPGGDSEVETILEIANEASELPSDIDDCSSKLIDTVIHLARKLDFDGDIFGEDIGEDFKQLEAGQAERLIERFLEKYHYDENTFDESITTVGESYQSLMNIVGS